MMYYKALTGSKQFHINTEHSDIDYFIITNENGDCTRKHQNIDLHYRTPKTFIYHVFEAENHSNAWHVLGALFSESVVETEFSKYLLENREKLIASNLRRFGEILFKYAKALSSQGGNKAPLGVQFPKRTIYAVMFLNAYIRYASENVTFEEAFKLSDELTEFIMGIRTQTISYETQMEKLSSMLSESESLKWFYDKEPDLVVFDRIKNEMKTLLGVN